MTRRGRSPSVKCAVGSSCTLLHSPDDPKATLPRDYLHLSPNAPAKRHCSFSYLSTDASRDGCPPHMGLNMEVKRGRDNESMPFSKQPSPREGPKFPPRIEKKDVPSLHQKLSKADKMERVRAETRARFSKATKVRDNHLYLKQQADDRCAGRAMELPGREGSFMMTTEPKEKEWVPPQLWALHWERNNPLSHKQQADGDAERAMALPKWEGPSMLTKEPKKKEWSPPRPWGLNWDRTSPLTCPMKLPWNEHCLCYNCVAPKPWGAELFRPGALLAKPAISGPKEPWRTKKAVDAPSAQPIKVLDTEGDRSGSVIKSEVATPGSNEVIKHGLKEMMNPGLHNPMRHAPTAKNPADSLPKLARVAANPSPAAQQTKPEEEQRKAVIGKDALPPPTDPSKEGLSAAGDKETEQQRRQRQRETLRKHARELHESIKHERWFQYRSIHESDLQKMEDELKISKDKLAVVKEVMEQDQQGLTKLLDTLRRGKKESCTQQDEKEHEGISKDVAAPTSSKVVDSQPPAQTAPDSSQQSASQVEPKGADPLSDLLAQWDREQETRNAAAAAKRALPCGTTEKLLLAFSISDLIVRLILLVTLWCFSTPWSSIGGAPSTVQITIAYFLTAAMLVGLWRMGFAHCMIGDGGDESDRILGLVERTDIAGFGVAVLLMVGLTV